MTSTMLAFHTRDAPDAQHHNGFAHSSEAPDAADASHAHSSDGEVRAGEDAGLRVALHMLAEEERIAAGVHAHSACTLLEHAVAEPHSAEWSNLARLDSEASARDAGSARSARRKRGDDGYISDSTRSLRDSSRDLRPHASPIDGNWGDEADVPPLFAGAVARSRRRMSADAIPVPRGASHALAASDDIAELETAAADASDAPRARRGSHEPASNHRAIPPLAHVRHGRAASSIVDFSIPTKPLFFQSARGPAMAPKVPVLPLKATVSLSSGADHTESTRIATDGDADRDSIPARSARSSLHRPRSSSDLHASIPGLSDEETGPRHDAGRPRSASGHARDARVGDITIGSLITSRPAAALPARHAGDLGLQRPSLPPLSSPSPTASLNGGLYADPRIIMLGWLAKAIDPPSVGAPPTAVANAWKWKFVVLRPGCMLYADAEKDLITPAGEAAAKAAATGLFKRISDITFTAESATFGAPDAGMFAAPRAGHPGGIFYVGNSRERSSRRWWCASSEHEKTMWLRALDIARRLALRVSAQPRIANAVNRGPASASSGPHEAPRTPARAPATSPVLEPQSNTNSRGITITTTSEGEPDGIIGSVDAPVTELSPPRPGGRKRRQSLTMGETAFAAVGKLLGMKSPASDLDDAPQTSQRPARQETHMLLTGAATQRSPGTPGSFGFAFGMDADTSSLLRQYVLDLQLWMSGVRKPATAGPHAQHMKHKDRQHVWLDAAARNLVQRLEVCSAIRDALSFQRTSRSEDAWDAAGSEADDERISPCGGAKSTPRSRSGMPLPLQALRTLGHLAMLWADSKRTARAASVALRLGAPSTAEVTPEQVDTDAASTSSDEAGSALMELRIPMHWLQVAHLPGGDGADLQQRVHDLSDAGGPARLRYFVTSLRRYISAVAREWRVRVSWDQVCRDLRRDEVRLFGPEETTTATLTGDGTNGSVHSMVHGLARVLLSAALDAAPQSHRLRVSGEATETFSLAVARHVLCVCDRTQSGGDAYASLLQLALGGVGFPGAQGGELALMPMGEHAAPLEFGIAPVQSRRVDGCEKDTRWGALLHFHLRVAYRLVHIPDDSDSTPLDIASVQVDVQRGFFVDFSVVTEQRGVSTDRFTASLTATQAIANTHPCVFYDNIRARVKPIRSDPAAPASSTVASRHMRTPGVSAEDSAHAKRVLANFVRRTRVVMANGSGLHVVPQADHRVELAAVNFVPTGAPGLPALTAALLRLSPQRPTSPVSSLSRRSASKTSRTSRVPSWQLPTAAQPRVTTGSSAKLSQAGSWSSVMVHSVQGDDDDESDAEAAEDDARAGSVHEFDHGKDDEEPRPSDGVVSQSTTRASPPETSQAVPHVAVPTISPAAEPVGRTGSPAAVAAASPPTKTLADVVISSARRASVYDDAVQLSARLQDSRPGAHTPLCGISNDGAALMHGSPTAASAYPDGGRVTPLSTQGDADERGMDARQPLIASPPLMAGQAALQASVIPAPTMHVSVRLSPGVVAKPAAKGMSFRRPTAGIVLASADAPGATSGIRDAPVVGVEAASHTLTPMTHIAAASEVVAEAAGNVPQAPAPIAAVAPAQLQSSGHTRVLTPDRPPTSQISGQVVSSTQVGADTSVRAVAEASGAPQLYEDDSTDAWGTPTASTSNRSSPPPTAAPSIRPASPPSWQQPGPEAEHQRAGERTELRTAHEDVGLHATEAVRIDTHRSQSALARVPSYLRPTAARSAKTLAVPRAALEVVSGQRLTHVPPPPLQPLLNAQMVAAAAEETMDECVREYRAHAGGLQRSPSERVRWSGASSRDLWATVLAPSSDRPRDHARSTSVGSAGGLQTGRSSTRADRVPLASELKAPSFEELGVTTWQPLVAERGGRFRRADEGILRRAASAQRAVLRATSFADLRSWDMTARSRAPAAGAHDIRAGQTAAPWHATQPTSAHDPKMLPSAAARPVEGASLQQTQSFAFVPAAHRRAISVQPATRRILAIPDEAPDATADRSPSGAHHARHRRENTRSLTSLGSFALPTTSSVQKLDRAAFDDGDHVASAWMQGLRGVGGATKVPATPQHGSRVSLSARHDALARSPSRHVLRGGIDMLPVPAAETVAPAPASPGSKVTQADRAYASGNVAAAESVRFLDGGVVTKVTAPAAFARPTKSSQAARTKTALDPEAALQAAKAELQQVRAAAAAATASLQAKRTVPTRAAAATASTRRVSYPPPATATATNASSAGGSKPLRASLSGHGASAAVRAGVSRPATTATQKGISNAAPPSTHRVAPGTAAVGKPHVTSTQAAATPSAAAVAASPHRRGPSIVVAAGTVRTAVRRLETSK